MASFGDSNSQSHTNPGVEDEPGTLHRTRSPVSQTAKPPKPKRSVRSVPVQEQAVNRRSTLTPIQRFRASVQKVINLKKTSHCLSGKGPGAEPGIDVRKDSAFRAYGHIKQSCLIEVADYSSVRSSFGKMTNREFISFLSDPTASGREHWVKVRWINVGGISWDVVRALALKYGASNPCHTSLHRYDIQIGPADLHPLSLEDLLTVPGRPRSGANYYKGHLFIRVLSHTLGTEGDKEPNLLEQIVRSSSPEPFEVEEKVDILPKYSTDDTRRSSGFTSKLSSKLKPPHGSATIEPECDDAKHVDMTGTTTFADYGSRYATYVRMHLRSPLSHTTTSPPF